MDTQISEQANQIENLFSQNQLQVRHIEELNEELEETKQEMMGKQQEIDRWKKQMQ